MKGNDSDLTAPAPLPPEEALTAVRQEAAGCRACDLYRRATQTVFGTGPATARVLMVGEQPGDREDIEGLPFVGPAGRILDEALEAAGIERSDVYVTNAVKHFKWAEGRGNRRLHVKPNVSEISACHPWLQRELSIIQPKVVVCLGATATRALLGPKVSVTRERGKLFEVDFAQFATVTGAPLLDPPPADRRRKAHGPVGIPTRPK